MHCYGCQLTKARCWLPDNGIDLRVLLCASPDVGQGPQTQRRCCTQPMRRLHAGPRPFSVPPIEPEESAQRDGAGGFGTRPRVFDCLPVAAPIGLSPLPILTLCGSERVLVVSTEPLDDLSCWTTPGVGCPGDGLLPHAVDQVYPDAGQGGGGWL